MVSAFFMPKHRTEVICWFTATILNANITTIKIRYALPIIPILLTGTACHRRESLEMITLRRLCKSRLKRTVARVAVDIKLIIQGLLSKILKTILLFDSQKKIC